jgi:predicted metal-dependent phosphoesterase TrpH
MFKMDMHVHTSEVSACGQISAKDGVKLYIQSGYQGVVITDHYTKDYFDNTGASNWNDKIDQFLTGYHKAKEEGQKLGLTVLLGIEIRFVENPSDYLVYGIPEEYLKENPKLYELGIEKFYEKIKNEDILVFQAHPYRTGMVVANPSYLHGVEGFNGNDRHESSNEKAVRFAKENNLLMSSGSDFHQLEDLAKGGIIFKQDITSVEELVSGLKHGEIIELLNIEL